MDWLINSPSPVEWFYVSNWFGKLFGQGFWWDGLRVWLSMSLLMLLPGLGLSYVLQPGELRRELRLPMATLLGFFPPLLLFFILGLSGLYRWWAWLLAGLLMSGVVIWRYGKRIVQEFHWKDWDKWRLLFYGLVGLYFFFSAVALVNNGLLDYDTLFGQIGPVSHLFFEGTYRPFDMGVPLISRHELFPGPIAFHSAVNALGVAPWLGVSLAMVFLAPLLVSVWGRLAEHFWARSEYFVVFLSLVTFAGFRLRSGRGTVLGLFFVFALLLLPLIFKELRKVDWRSLLRPSVFVSLMIALALYINVEMGAIILGATLLWAVMAWLTGQRALQRVLLWGMALGFVLYAPWFVIVITLIFSDSMTLMFGLYALLIVAAVGLAFVPALKLKKALVLRGIVALIVLGTGVLLLQGRFTELLRLPTFLPYMGGLALGAALLYAAWKPDWKRDSLWVLPLCFGVLMFMVIPWLKPVFVGLGAPEQVLYFLFDKPLGSVFPELAAKLQEYFLPIFSVFAMGALLSVFVKWWPWKKWMSMSLIVILMFFAAVRIHESDFEDYVKGQTLAANVLYLIATPVAFVDTPQWFAPEALPMLVELEKYVEPGDRFFDFYSVNNPYQPETQLPYLVLGLGAVSVGPEDLVAQQYAPEVLDQLVDLAVDFVLIQPGPGGDAQNWLDDSRTEILYGDGTHYILLKISSS